MLTHHAFQLRQQQAGLSRQANIHTRNPAMAGAVNRAPTCCTAGIAVTPHPLAWQGGRSKGRVGYFHHPTLITSTQPPTITHIAAAAAATTATMTPTATVSGSEHGSSGLHGLAVLLRRQQTATATSINDQRWFVPAIKRTNKQTDERTDGMDG